MHALRVVAVVCMVACAAASAQAETLFPGAVARPNNKGDQVIFYYDARDGFTTFVNLRNESASALHVTVLYYGADFSVPFSQALTLPLLPGTSGAAGTGGLVVIDVGALRASGLAATPGVAIATAVDDSGRAIVTRGLSGNFTVANLATGSAWGSAGAARSAIHPPTTPTGTCTEKQPSPTLGSVIDGTTIVLTPIQPASADLAAFYNPETLAPAADGGNQLIFVSFVDVPGSTYAAAAAKTTWKVTGVRSTGEALTPTHVDVNGVVISDLVSVAGPAVNGGSGALTFTDDPRSAPLTRLVFFTETLGTFSTGYLLPRK